MEGDREPGVAVPVLCGPTASGKTAVATELAALLPVEIIAADSRQIYRGLDVGTAKPSRSERSAAPYHGIDLVEPRERYSAGRFAREAAGWIADIRERARVPLLVGGTGFYLKALFEGLAAEPQLDAERRTVLNAALAKREAPELDRWARRLDASYRGGGRQRAQRVIEIALLAGRRLGALHAAQSRPQDPARPLYFVIRMERAALRERIARRVETMLAAGLVEETRAVLRAGVPADAPALSGVGYRECVALLAGRLGQDDLAPAIAAATRRYAKRQETWFRHQLPATAVTLEGGETPRALARAVLAGYRAACA